MEKRKRAPFNTAREAQEFPAGIILESIAVGVDKAICNQETQGQKSFVNSETLPVQISAEDRRILEDAGVKFGEKVEGDNLFQYVELPEGWKKVPTDHSMWSNLVDDKGRKRASIFYKAAFYDRDAHLLTSRRYNYYFDYERQEKDGVGVTNITDGDKPIHTTEPITVGDRESYEVSSEANKLAEAWLDANYPNWRNANAYWD